MRRVVLTLVAAVALTFATGLPVASFGLTNVTLSCDDGTSIVTQVDVDTLANLTVPGGQCIPEGHVTSKPTCLTINAEQPKPPDGAWFAYLWSHATQKSGSLSTFPDDFGSGWKDTGNPAKQTIGPDRVVLADASTCPTNGSPDPDGLGSRPILNGNITIHAIE